MDITFEDRAEAGQFVAHKLLHYADRPDVIVLGLPRGGVPVAYEVAQTLDAPLDVFIVRKLGVPDQEELAMGAIAMGGIRVLNARVIEEMGIARKQIDAVIELEQQELKRREKLYRGDLPSLAVQGYICILVDDGLATGASMWAAVVALRRLEPAKIVVAVPVASAKTCALFREEVDDLVCGIVPELFQAVGLFYKNFDQTPDEEVNDLLSRANDSKRQSMHP